MAGSQWGGTEVMRPVVVVMVVMVAVVVVTERWVPAQWCKRC